ncbi:META domain-containing protein [Devosia limi]|uniref:Putative lipoprotein n=1 Tax=Devosia limi DSM 17137 TaxID=1121477 RepID=A0A1M5DNW1_9HYPH|nr:META domain-containing protein [Devosia limi]SHF68673.1 putative lipoprotein [Devosia limi DSM 17137]
MFASICRRLGTALLMLLLAVSAASAIDNAITFTGEVTYRERIALPPNAELRVTLMSLAEARPKEVVGASAVIPAIGQVPLQFTLNVRSDAIRGSQYGLKAEILSGGAVVFRNPVPVPVDPAAPLSARIIVNLVPPSISNEPELIVPAELEVTTDLFDTIWQVQSIAGKSVLGATKVSLSIAPDRRAGGNGGCNNYFTEAMFDGPMLSFGPIAGTRMACGGPVMAQEATFFAALQATTGYELADATLHLLDADGKRLVRLSRGQ